MQMDIRQRLEKIGSVKSVFNGIMQFIGNSRKFCLDYWYICSGFHLNIGVIIIAIPTVPIIELSMEREQDVEVNMWVGWHILGNTGDMKIHSVQMDSFSDRIFVSKIF